MSGLTDLGLTPSQLAEVEQADPDLVSAWLELALHPPESIKNPVAWFLAKVRDGTNPAAVNDLEKAKRVRAAEKWIHNAGLFQPTEAELTDALFGPYGKLKAWADDDALHARFAQLWAAERPRGEACEAATADRATRWRAANEQQQQRDDDDLFGGAP